MEGEISVMQVEKRIRNRVKRQMEKTQREYYLNEQMKAIQKELGERSEEHTSELQSLMRISYAVFCLKKKNKLERHTKNITAKKINTTHDTKFNKRRTYNHKGI